MLAVRPVAWPRYLVQPDDVPKARSSRRAASGDAKWMVFIPHAEMEPLEPLEAQKFVKI